MSSLDLDFEILNDDYERLVALESIGVPPDYPALCAIRRRWCLEMSDEEVKAVGESRAMMERAQATADGAAEGSLTAKYAKKVAGKAGKVAFNAGYRAGNKIAHVAGATTKNLLAKFHSFAADLAKEQIEYMKEATSKATELEKKLQKLSLDLKEHKNLGSKPVKSGNWASKVCFEDKVDVKACLAFVDRGGAMEDAVQEYTVRIRGVLTAKRKMDGGELDKFGRSTNWAIKRSAGLMGIVNPFKKVTARPLPGNIVIVEHHNGLVRYAVANKGVYDETIPALSYQECEASLKAVKEVIVLMRERGVKRKAVGYTGINEEVEHMRSELKHVEGKDLVMLTKAYKSALALEDAFTTALVRVGEGLLTYVKQSIKENS